MNIFDEVLRRASQTRGVTPAKALEDLIAGRANLPGKLDMSKFTR